MPKIGGGRLLVKALKNEGVEHIFALSGGHIDPIFQACIDEEVRIIDTRHEQAAAHMADGWARVTGKPGVALVTAGPGVTDAVTGVANAFQAASPMILIGGHSPLAQFEMGSLQEMDQVTLMRTVTKSSWAVYETSRIPEFMSMGFRHALAGRPGPVYLDIPEDVLAGEVEEEQILFPAHYRTTARPQGDLALVDKAVDLLLSAQRPVVIAGSGVWWSQAGKELRALIETGKLPLVLIWMGRGSVPEDHPLCFGPTRVGIRQADVILVIGTRFNYGLAYGRPPLFSQDVKVIQIDIDASEIGHNRPIEIGIVGDAQAVLKQMVEAAWGRCQQRAETPWIEQCRAYVKSRRQRIEADLTSDKVPIHPLRLCKEISDFVDREATLIMDGGDITVWGATALRVYHPGHWLDNGPMGCLGPGIPFSIAAKLARPDKQVVGLSGDGSFGLNAMEFDTAARHKIPIVIIVGNDGAWGMAKHDQEDRYGPDRVIGTELGFTRYDKMVQGLGGHGEFVERPEDIRPALERAFASGLPACVNVKIDPAVAPGRTSS